MGKVYQERLFGESDLKVLEKYNYELAGNMAKNIKKKQ